MTESHQQTARRHKVESSELSEEPHCAQDYRPEALA